MRSHVISVEDPSLKPVLRSSSGKTEGKLMKKWGLDQHNRAASVHNRCSSQACPFPRHGRDRQHLRQAGARLSHWGQTDFSAWVLQGSCLTNMIHSTRLCRVETCAHKMREGTKKEVQGHLFFPDSHTVLPFPLAHAVFLLCRATWVLAHIKPKAILALYWHPVETQEHIRQQLHLFS